MGIKFFPEQRLFVLEAADCTFAFMVHPRYERLVHLYHGPHLGGDEAYKLLQLRHDAALAGRHQHLVLRLVHHFADLVPDGMSDNGVGFLSAVGVGAAVRWSVRVITVVLSGCAGIRSISLI